jgi:LPXTG-site transpeptidase (sortase) family protein
MLKKLLILIIIIEIILIPLIIISNDKKIIIKKVYTLKIEKKEQPIAKITINKININEDIYGINSDKNTIEQHVTILKGSNYPNLLILAAHSGKGDIAYFENLDELTINDEVFIQYRNDKKTYIVKEIWEEKKNGKIHIDNNINQLILTTCSPKHKNYQLIISCIKKESIT